MIQGFRAKGVSIKNENYERFDEVEAGFSSDSVLTAVMGMSAHHQRLGGGYRHTVPPARPAKCQCPRVWRERGWQDAGYRGDPEGPRRVRNAGGGTVQIPPGSYLSKPIFLHSSTTVKLDAGAVLQATDETADFVNPERTNSFIAFVNGRDIHDVAIVGPGTIDGAGAKWWIPAEEARARRRATRCPDHG